MHFHFSGPGATALGAAPGAIACGACAPLAGFLSPAAPVEGRNFLKKVSSKTFSRLRAFGPAARTRFYLSLRRGLQPPVSPAGSVGPGRSPPGTRTPSRDLPGVQPPRTRFYLSIKRGVQPPLRGATCPGCNPRGRALTSRSSAARLALCGHAPRKRVCGLITARAALRPVPRIGQSGHGPVRPLVHGLRPV